MTEPQLIDNRFLLENEIGRGSFGRVFIGQDVTTNEKVAIKVEAVDTKHPQLVMEAKIIAALSHPHKSNSEKISAVPSLKWCGTAYGYNIMVCNLLGPSLDDQFQKCNKKFSLKTTIMLGIQMLRRVEHIHDRGFVHRDLKPGNFLMGVGKKANVVYAIDFGLSKKFRDSRTGRHITYSDTKNLLGTARYASINNHMGIEQSRRDDLESLGYLLIYFLKGVLPWQGITGTSTKDKYNRICHIKTNTSSKALCKGLPAEFVKYFNYVKALSFEDLPNYKYLRTLFRDILTHNGLRYDCEFDWMLLEAQVPVIAPTTTDVSGN